MIRRCATHFSEVFFRACDAHDRTSRRVVRALVQSCAAVSCSRAQRIRARARSARRARICARNLSFKSRETYVDAHALAQRPASSARRISLEASTQRSIASTTRVLDARRHALRAARETARCGPRSKSFKDAWKAARAKRRWYE
jgi:hypothetical protein